MVRFEKALPIAEGILLRLADEHLDRTVSPGLGVVAQGLGFHAAELYRGVLAACNGDAVTPAIVVCRALVETAILLRWLEREPSRHIAMWLAEDDRRRLIAATAFYQVRRQRGRPLGAPVFSADQQRDMRQQIADVRARARAAGEPIGEHGPVIPSVDRMADPTDGTLWEAYEIAYRTLSVHTHGAARAMVGHRLEERPDGLHVVPGQVWTPSLIRALAAPTFAVALGSVSRQSGLGIEEECWRLQISLATWQTDVPDSEV